MVYWYRNSVESSGLVGSLVVFLRNDHPWITIDFNPGSRSGVELESQPMGWLGLEPWFLLGGVVRAIRQLHNYEIINLFKVHTYLLPGSLNQQLSCCSINNLPYLFGSLGQLGITSFLPLSVCH